MVTSCARFPLPILPGFQISFPLMVTIVHQLTAANDRLGACCKIRITGLHFDLMISMITLHQPCQSAETRVIILAEKKNQSLHPQFLMTMMKMMMMMTASVYATIMRKYRHHPLTINYNRIQYYIKCIFSITILYDKKQQSIDT